MGSVNQYTLHAGTGGGECKLDPNVAARYRNKDGGSQQKNFLGKPVGLECVSSFGHDAGCGVKDFEGSAGHPFNAAGGGVVAMLWDETQIAFWRFKRNKVPEDIHRGHPNPETWGVPVAYWSNKSCDITKAFRNHNSTSIHSDYLAGLLHRLSYSLFSYHQHRGLW